MVVVVTVVSRSCGSGSDSSGSRRGNIGGGSRSD